MSALSDVDIVKELGKNIFIHPIKDENLKGATINLTASEYAWCISNGECAFISSSRTIKIPAHDTVLIETEEVIYISKKICGTYHSKCKLVSKGLGHVGTTLDPEFIGPSLIAIHNHTNFDKEIDVGDSFVSLTLYYLNSKSTVQNTNEPGQSPLLNECKLSKSAQKWLDSDWRKSSVALKRRMIESEPYKNIKLNYISKNKSWYYFNNIITQIVVLAIVIIGTYYAFKYIQGRVPTLKIDFFIGAWVTAIIAFIIDKIKKI